MKYRTIVADPPWEYPEGWPAASTSPKAVGRSFPPPSSERRSLPYPSLSVDDVLEVPVPALALQSAHLFLWTTNRYLREAYGVVEAWGFTPSQLLVWCKRPKGIGPGGVFANSCEFILYARRGKPKHLGRKDSTWWLWPRSNSHSRKPEAFLDLVEQVAPGPYLELFARRQRLGWDTWGNEALNHIQRVAGAA